MKMAAVSLSLFVVVACAPQVAFAELKIGAAIVDVTPQKFPVLINGGFTSKNGNPRGLYARAIVLDDGRERLAIVVVDSCMLPRDLLDEAKTLAAQQTKIRPERMLISATHTHSAPSAMGCLGTDADPTYVPYLRIKLAEAVAMAEANLEPARVGWAVRNAPEYTALRRWILRPNKMRVDPFGNRTMRANMHAAKGNLDVVTGESGPEDPELPLISFQSLDGRPIAVLANFSMHYFGGGAGADYFGIFCKQLESRITQKYKAHAGMHDVEQASKDVDTPQSDQVAEGVAGGTGKTEDGPPPLVSIMSHGCSGDIWRVDYRTGKKQPSITAYVKGMVDIAMQAYDTIEYQADVDLAMAEKRMKLNYRVPNKQLLEWAQRIVKETSGRLPRSLPQVYAREQVLLHERQSTEVVVQALRIGDIAIATTPNETYALTGLKLKLQSPLRKTMVIELANGGDGYIPPPEQHFLGGYNTWPARSAGLEVEAEPKITEAALQLLEKVARKPRVRFKLSCGPACERLLNAKPVAYWRLDELAGPRAVDSSGHNRDGIYESGVVFFLTGPRSKEFCKGGQTNRAAHFAGGRLRTRIADLKSRYSVSLWFWNGMPDDARGVAGWMFSRGHDHGLGPHGDHLGIGGTAGSPGQLIFLHGDEQQGAKPVAGRTKIKRWTWNHVVLVRDGGEVRVYLNGKLDMTIASAVDSRVAIDRLFFGGRSDNRANWEGRLDELAVFDRALSKEEVQGLNAQ